MMLRTLRAIGTITANQLHRLVIDPATYIWLVTLPLLITYVLGISLNSLFAPTFEPVRPYQVGLVQHSQAVGAPIYGVLESMPKLFTVTLYEDEASAQADLLDKNITATIIVPPNPIDEPVRVVSAPGGFVTQILHDVIRPVLDGATVMVAGAAPTEVEFTSTQLVTADAGVKPASQASEAWANTSSFQYYSIAIAVMFAMFAANVAMGYCAGDFTTGSFARIRALGVSRSSYLFAGYLSAVVMALLFITAMTIMTSLFFGVRWGDLSAWIPFTLIASLASAAITYLLLSVLPADPKLIDGAGSLVFNFIAFLGGSTAPLPALPQWLVSVTAWLPNRAILEGYLRLSAGSDLQAVSGELSVLAINILVLLSLSLISSSLRPKGAM